jgi:uncharacterized protein YjbI with pentapeptide repeats
MKTKLQIKSVFGSVLFEFEKEDNSIKDTLIEAIKQRTNLSRADLSRTNLSRTNISGTNLSGTNLSRANLSRADLSRTDLSRANLSRADLSRTNLSRADLSGTNLSGTDLSGTDLSGTNLSRANLSRADLSRTNLSRTNLSGTNLSGTYLSGTNLSGADLKKIYPLFQIVPSEGSFIAWKKGKDNHLIKIEIPTGAKRHNYLGGRKCRAEFVKVLDIRNSKGHKVKECFNRTHSEKILYKVGEIVRPDSYDPSPLNECSNGIHFFLTKEEAKAWGV